MQYHVSRIGIGDDAPEFSLPSIDGQIFDMSKTKGNKVILTFFRFSSCPFCNIRIDRIIKRWDEFDDGTIMVGLFDADIQDLRKRMSGRSIPFAIVANDDYSLFRKYSVEKSFARFMWGAIRSPLTFLSATLKGYFPRTMSISKMSTIPVDVLIDESGKVVEAHYYKDTADHISIDRLIQFSKVS